MYSGHADDNVDRMEMKNSARRRQPIFIKTVKLGTSLIIPCNCKICMCAIETHERILGKLVLHTFAYVVLYRENIYFYRALPA